MFQGKSILDMTEEDREQWKAVQADCARIISEYKEQQLILRNARFPFNPGHPDSPQAKMYELSREAWDKYNIDLKKY